MKFTILLILCSFSLCAWARKKPIPSSLKGQYVFVDGNSVLAYTGLMFVGYTSKDSLGKGISLSLGFPLYEQTIVSRAKQKHCLGLEFGYAFKNVKLAKRDYITIEPRCHVVSRSEEDRFDYYQIGDSLYPYKYAKIHSIRFGINPTIMYNCFLSQTFLLSISAGIQSFAEKVKYDDVVRYPNALNGSIEGRSPNRYQVGWNFFIREFIGIKLSYKLK